MAQQHYAELERRDGRFIASVAGTTVAEADHVIALEEVYGDRRLPAVLYFPPGSLKPEFYSATDHATHCPIKGDASYYTITVGDTAHENAAWYYPHPLESLCDMGGYVAFYPKYVEVTEQPMHPRHSRAGGNPVG